MIKYILIFFLIISPAFANWRSDRDVSQRGLPMCYMTAEANDSQLYFKFFRGSSQIIVHAFNNYWLFQPVTQMNVEIKIDGVTVWTGNGGGAYDALEMSITDDQVETFFPHFINGRNISVVINNEPPAHVTLNGSRAAFGAFSTCIRNDQPRQQPQPRNNSPRYRT